MYDLDLNSGEDGKPTSGVPTMTLTPAYGRDYKNKKEVLADFDADKDFVVNDMRAGGTYTNKSDLKRMDVKYVNIRYKKMTQVAVVKL